MLLSSVFERFTQKRPVSVMMRAWMEHAMSPDAPDALFETSSERQYTRRLLFSSVVDLMGLVVCKSAPSVHAAFQAVSKRLPVSVTAVYDKLNNTEPQVAAALVEHVARRLGEVIESAGGALPQLVPGHRVRMLDGNHLAATERRLEVLRGSKAGPLPGHAWVVMDPALMLATHMIPCEDGHAQERSLTPRILELVDARDIWVAGCGARCGDLDPVPGDVARRTCGPPASLGGRRRPAQAPTSPARTEEARDATDALLDRDTCVDGPIAGEFAEEVTLKGLRRHPVRRRSALSTAARRRANPPARSATDGAGSPGRAQVAAGSAARRRARTPRNSAAAST